MFYSDELNESVYTDLMNQIKKVNTDWLKIRNSNQYKRGLVINETLTSIKHMEFEPLLESAKRWIRGSKSRKIVSKNSNSALGTVSRESNYFSQDRVAIYTAIFGGYDKILEPYCVPNNCDFYIFTDRKIEVGKSKWIKKDSPKSIESLSNAEKNRYLKMHPDELFPDYKYSIYVDGNVQIITDLTEYINILGETGIGIHLHNLRNCVYDELDATVKTGRVKKNDATRYRKYLLSTGMPKSYGLLQCSVIVREHHNEVCRNVMKQWWQEYCKYTKRDQVSLPHILYMNNISVNEIGIMGENLYANPSFRIMTHN